MYGVCLHSHTLRGFIEERRDFFLIKADGAWNYSLPLGAEFKNSWSLCSLTPLTGSLSNGGSISGKGKKYIMAPSCLDRFCYPFILLFSGVPEALLPRRTAFDSSLSSAKVKNEWSCTSTLPDVFAVCAEKTCTTNANRVLLG